MNDLNLNPIPNNSNLPNTDINKNNLTKKGCLEFDLPVIEDKIVVGNKKFDDIRFAVKYLVKQSNEYAYNIQIKNIAPTPTKIHVVTTFDYEEPRRVTITIIIARESNSYSNLYIVDRRRFDQLEDAVKYIVDREYGKYADLVIDDVKILGNRDVKVTVRFIDIPDINQDM
jgi:hypothetical protein